CLNYELDTYLDALQFFPDNADTLKVSKGIAFLIKKDIFKNLLWYTLPDSNKQYPVTIDRVKKIQQLNSQGVIPDELEAVDVTTSKPREVEPEFVDVVGQISLRSLEKTERRRKPNKPGGGGRPQQNPGQQNQGQSNQGQQNQQRQNNPNNQRQQRRK
ncbi:MAG TPA: hypothetical protein VEB42_16660, partial [Chitinophagaceae bacterium]|nr:hypothetical protein [Chitinophagaceae bacterium]